ncbi:MAG TPA: glycine--tRNA ligase subunit beta [Steroidobacteraceae bacterium]|nr:glycine--tRNA ligase subunit beta [Steroidobacteraceae bacterium]
MSGEARPERRDFLFELGTEELPPKALPVLELALREGITARLARAALRHGAIESFATPRRLAVRVRRLSSAQPEQDIRRRGPPLRAAYDEAGAQTRAAQAFAASCGVEISALGRERDDRNIEYLCYAGRRAGASAQSLLPGIVAEALDALPIPKRMRWGTSEAQFVRPVHWLVMLYGAEIVPATILDTVAGRSTRGHRFHAPRELSLRAPASYEGALLKRGKVIASFAGRRERVRVQLLATAAQLGGQAVIDPALLEEVTALVEWPVAVAGRYEERFLILPREVLLATLQDHQRYFAVQSEAGALLPWFITIANIESRDVAVVRAGNERVVRPRLADAAFFWEQDRRTPLAARTPQLARVSYQAQLGSLADKSGRIERLAMAVANACGATPERAARAAQLGKCDLVTNMVGEFPELQGVMGGYYAAADGEEAEVAAAIGEHYLPRGAGDHLPATPAGKALALADRLDTLAGNFAIGQKPSGTRDPFGLRRAAIGLLRLALELKIDFDLRALLEQAVAAQPLADLAPRRAAVTDELYAFVLERLRAQYLEDAASGVTTEIFDAVLATAPRSLLDADARARALVKFLALPDAASLAAANRRIANILKKSPGEAPQSTDPTRLQAPAERALHAALAERRIAVDVALGRGDYAAAFAELARLRPPIDAFFDAVLVNDPDAALRGNRLALLGELRALFTRSADLSLLPG